MLGWGPSGPLAHKGIHHCVYLQLGSSVSNTKHDLVWKVVGSLWTQPVKIGGSAFWGQPMWCALSTREMVARLEVLSSVASRGHFGVR